MAELLITGVWLATLGAVVYVAAAEIAKLLSIQDVPRRRGRRGVTTTGGAMYFDVTRIEREAMVSERIRRADRRSSRR
jgi:hypothetical protein